MKRVGNLWTALTSFSNLVRAAQKASRGKRRFANVARFQFELETQLCRLQDELRTKTYTPGEYRTFQIFEPKPRMISAAPFGDRVVHHALCGVIEPVVDRTFILDSYACRRGKGTHAAIDRFGRFARRHRYVLKCDVAKFFPSIDHAILKDLVERKVKDPDVLWLVHLIIDRSNAQEPVLEWFPGDDLFRPTERRRGLPIGNQTSQFFANVYLNPFDHFVKEVLRARAYIRYVDDFVLFSDDKKWLAMARHEIRRFLASLRLRLHSRKSVISRVADGTRFLGYRVFPYRRTLVRENVTRMRHRLQRLQKAFRSRIISAADISCRIASWIGHARHANTFRLRQRLFDRITFSRGPGGEEPGSGVH